ncbi:cyclin-dependent kinase inhibitor 1D isoform X1 [Scleropages formosus]|nr:cyclin-dependent kinase inhibitor 1-like isoform X1 [Scleropages formosus]
MLPHLYSAFRQRRTDTVFPLRSRFTWKKIGIIMVLYQLQGNMAGISSESDIAPFSGEEVKPRLGSVRRNLFGPVDHQQLQQDFQRLLRMSVEEATRRWNFDFQSDRPTPGATEWEELRCQDVPAFYRSCMVKSGVGPRAEPPSRGCGGSSPPVGEYLEITARETYRCCEQEKRVSVAATGKRRQAIITDFFAVKKRRLLHPKGHALQ